MKEYENGGDPFTTEHIHQTLLDRLESAEFDSVTFQAASDYFALNRQRELLGIEIDNVLSAGTDQKKKMYWESETRIRETQIALLEHDIESNKSRIPGYSRSYLDLSIAFEDLATAANVEAEKRHPTDKKKRDRYGRAVFDRIYDQINDLIYARQDEQ